MSKKAFTLVEILVVLSIIAIIGAFAIVRMRGAISSANDSEKKVNLNSIKKALFLYGVEHLNSYPIETGCNIGSCTNLDSAMTNVLPTSIDGTYTYQSDGTEFTLSTVLSSGYAYSYDSETNSFTTQEPTNGVCGSANKTYTYDSTTYGSDTFCQTGSSTPTTPSFPTVGNTTSWTCPGQNGGSVASCSATRNNTPINGSCGSSNGANLSEQPSTNLCTTGTATTVSGSGPWTWSCTGQYTGTTASCSTAGVPVNGACGSANKTYAYDATSYGSDTYCTTGSANPVSPSFPTQGNTTSWTCDGLNTGTTASCSATRPNAPINGSCGTKNGKYASTTPTGTQACATGTISNMTGTYSWTCAGQYSGTNASCATVAAAYTVVSFTTVGTSSWTVPTGITSVDYLVVGGGGGGSAGTAGGGGAGGFRTASDFAVTPGASPTVTVGAGGTGGIDSSSDGLGTSGGNSVFSTITSYGGGAGGTEHSYNGTSGGSGGGGGGVNTITGGSGTSGQGNNGGNGSTSSSNYGGGGGGGAGAVGGTATSSVAGNGGAGLSSSITGSTVWYAGGGGGAGRVSGGGGSGGTGGGGSGSNGSGTVPGNGTANTGGGGGGEADGSNRAGNGGSGIVVVRYINNY